MPTILLATPDKDLNASLFGALFSNYELEVVTTGWEAMTKCEEQAFDIAIVYADLPGLNGYDILKRLKDTPSHKALGLFLFAPSDRDWAQGVLQHNQCKAIQQFPCNTVTLLRKIWTLSDILSERKWKDLSPLQSKLLRVTKKNLTDLYASAAKEKSLNMGLVDQCSDAIVEVAHSSELGEVLETLRHHHGYTFVHSLNVAALLVMFGIHTGIKGEDLKTLARGGLIHDLGKSLTPADILDKPGSLDDEEWVVMRRHVDMTREILGNSSFIPEAVTQIAEEHHEKLDGTGYPHGLKGSDISDPGLIASIVDVYSALVDKRAYKPSYNTEEALETLNEMSGYHLEPHFLKAFEEMIRSGV